MNAVAQADAPGRIKNALQIALIGRIVRIIKRSGVRIVLPMSIKSNTERAIRNMKDVIVSYS